MTADLFTEKRLTEVMHDLNEKFRGGCDHSMSKFHDDDRPGYERSCLLDARYILKSSTEEDRR